MRGLSDVEAKAGTPAAGFAVEGQLRRFVEQVVSISMTSSPLSNSRPADRLTSSRRTAA